MTSAVKVDNIPIGIAAFASISSRISYSLSEMLEMQLLPADIGVSNRYTGIMFGAKAVAKIKEIQIENPATLTNTKEFLRQCFMKPYVMGNILGRKAAAKNTSDIIGFIEQNIPNNFGIYYRDQTTISFKSCRQATPLIKESINKELNDGLLAKFASAIGMQLDNKMILNLNFKIAVGDTLKYLKQEQSNAYEWEAGDGAEC